MGKTASLRKRTSTSIHSRAAKRTTSPSLNLDKSLRSVPLPTSSTTPTEIPTTNKDRLAKAINDISMRTSTSSGISKSKNKRLTSKQRKRKLLGKEKAEAVIDKLEKKVGESVAKGKIVEERRKNWEEANGRIEVRTEQAAELVVELRGMK